MPDGVLKDGATVMFHNLFNKHNLAVNIWDATKITSEMYGSSCTPSLYPMARSVFKLVKANDQKSSRQDNNVIHYGDKFRIVANKRLLGKDKQVYLTSDHTSTMTFAKISHYNEVLFTTKGETFNCIWEFEHIDPKIRFEMAGEPVGVADEILLKHCHTSNWLGAQKDSMKNLYGTEIEVFVHSFFNKSKTQNLISEKVGRTTCDTTLRGQGTENHFCLVAAQRSSDEFDESVIEKPIKVEDLITYVQQF